MELSMPFAMISSFIPRLLALPAPPARQPVTRSSKNALRLDLLNAATLREYSSQPERLIASVSANTDRKYIVIDEIQKLPQLLDAVHLLIELKGAHQFVLTGSSARKLRRQGTNLLGGRAVQKHLHPYMACELGNKFDLRKTLTHGLLPVVWAASDAEEILQAYNGLYLREEVQMEGLVRNAGDFARFLETMSFSHASVPCEEFLRALRPDSFPE
jgi:predicted AAA+ superfamily ATPase